LKSIIEKKAQRCLLRLLAIQAAVDVGGIANTA
jgi:hypothetical protein